MSRLAALVPRLNRAFESSIAKVEHAATLDPIADTLQSAVKLYARRPLMKSALSGSAVGHPAHPSLVLLPMGSWLSASALDAFGGEGARTAAQRLVGLGVLTSIPAALSGAGDWTYTTGAERRVGLVHAASVYVSIGLYAGSWLARRRSHQATGAALSGAGCLALTTAGWLGGHLTYARGVGVDTTAFQVAPADWVDAIDESAVEAGQLTLVHADGIPVLLLHSDGVWTAMADRCTHRGAPLHEGAHADGCITCPWHDTVFSLEDGAVIAGPASRPQPMYEVRTRYGKVQVRRSDEPGSLRTNAIA